FVVVCGPSLWERWFGKPVINNALAGQSEAQIRDTYGEPVSEKHGYQTLGLQNPDRFPVGALKTLIFHPRGLRHLEGGTLWVWIRQQPSGEWICFESCWFANGVQF